MGTRVQHKSGRVRPVVLTALVSLVICGLLFPIILTGVAQVLFPYQANGELAKVGGQTVGSMVALNSSDYTLPVFFHARNNTASGFDPDITVPDAAAQIPRISESSGVAASSLQALIESNQQGTLFGLGTPYVSVQQLNLDLISEFPAQYAGYG